MIFRVHPKASRIRVNYFEQISILSWIVHMDNCEIILSIFTTIWPNSFYAGPSVRCAQVLTTCVLFGILNETGDQSQMDRVV